MADVVLSCTRFDDLSAPFGIGERDVAVRFDAVKHETRNGKVYLTLDATKDALSGAG
jgi:hypothetical protein